jgi:hypothetical protein
MKKLFAVPFLLWIFAFNAQASTVTFEDNAVNSHKYGSFTSGELTFTLKSGTHFIDASNPGAHNGSNALLAGEGHYHYFDGYDVDFGGGYTFKETDKSVFSLNSIDAGTSYGSTYMDSGMGSVVLTGHQLGGGTLTQTLLLNYSYTHHVFTWTNLLSVDVSANVKSGYIAYDNINVNPVPVPAAVWLFGSALTGLLGLGKFKQSKALAA